MTVVPTVTFTLAQALGAPAQGPALVSPRPFSARYDLDSETGVITRLGHPLYGRPIAGTILVCPAVQGGVAAGWMLMKLAARGVGFAGLAFGRINPVMVQGAQAAGIAIGAGLAPDAFQQLHTDDLVRLDPQAHQLMLL